MTEFEKTLKIAESALKIIGTGALRELMVREGPRTYWIPDPTPDGRKALKKHREEVREIEEQYEKELKQENDKA